MTHNESAPQNAMAPGDLFGSVTRDMVAVLTRPVVFFKNMPREGGYVMPLVFMATMALFNAILMTVIGLMGLGSPVVMAMGFMTIIMFPLITAIFGFIGAAILFLIWKIMGSTENFETTYRCVAYSYAYAPVAAILSIIPYLGSLVGAFYPMALLALASIYVHGRKQKISWLVFGSIGLVLALSSFGAESAGRRLASNAVSWQQQVEEGFKRGGKEIYPERAESVGSYFLKG